MNFYKHVFLFFYVSSMMMLSCPCGHDLKTWSSQNLMRSYVDDQKILIMSKFENTKKWSCENDECRAGSHPGYLHFWVSWYFDHVIFWESRNFGHERNRIRYDICAGRQLFGCLGDLSVGVCVCPCKQPHMPPRQILKSQIFWFLLGTLQDITHLPLSVSVWIHTIPYVCPCVSL